MIRGDLITVSLARDYGKPRPAIIVQSNRFRNLESVTVVPLTSYEALFDPLRVALDPTPRNGLRLKSQVMIDKITSLPRERAGGIIGQLSEHDMNRVDRALAVFLGFA
jgi:mRNA interferase MazF